MAEPCPRDTAPCVGLAAGIVAAKDPSATMIVMPADHVIEPVEAFRTSVPAAVAVIDDDPSALVTFGITPTRPETGYGYIERGPLLEDRRGIPVYRVLQFREKPDRPTAEQFLGRRQLPVELGHLRLAGRHDPRRVREHRPQLGDGPRADPACHRHSRRARGPGPALPPARTRPDRQGRDGARAERPRARGPLQLERRRRLACAGHPPGTRRRPATPSRGTSSPATRPDSIVISDDGGLVATLGVDDLVVVHSGKATLVARKDRLDELKALVEGLAQAGLRGAPVGYWPEGRNRDDLRKIAPQLPSLIE